MNHQSFQDIAACHHGTICAGVQEVSTQTVINIFAKVLAKHSYTLVLPSENASN